MCRKRFGRPSVKHCIEHTLEEILHCIKSDVGGFGVYSSEEEEGEAHESRGADHGPFAADAGDAVHEGAEEDARDAADVDNDEVAIGGGHGDVDGGVLGEENFGKVGARYAEAPVVEGLWAEGRRLVNRRLKGMKERWKRTYVIQTKMVRRAMVKVEKSILYRCSSTFIRVPQLSFNFFALVPSIGLSESAEPVDVASSFRASKTSNVTVLSLPLNLAILCSTSTALASRPL